MTTEAFLQLCALISIAILMVAFFVICIRIIVGPTLPDRILGLDMLVATGIGFIAVVAVKTGYFLYLDIAIALGLVGFLATVAFARFIMKRDKPEEGDLVSTGSKVATPHPPHGTQPGRVSGKGRS